MKNNLELHVKNAYQANLNALQEFICRQDHATQTLEIGLAMAAALSADNKILVCGNGGSACQAMHFAEELTGRYRQDRRALAALALTDSAHITCVANDYGFEDIFSRAITALGKRGDCLLVLSTSGNSPNLLRAVDAAKALGITTLGLLGRDGGQLKQRCDLELIVQNSVSDSIQNIQMIIIHTIIEIIERQLFPENY